MDKIKTVKIKNEDGTVSEESYSISVDATNVDMSNGKDLQDTVGNINVDEDGNIASQLKKIDKKINVSDIIDNLNTEQSNKPLSAKQGYELNVRLNKKPYYYNTIADMKVDTKLKVGDMAITLGYYKVNDGGGAEYKIINGNYTDDGGSHHKIENGLFAELIIRDRVSIDQFGAKHISSFDNNPIYENMVAAGIKTIYFNAKKYYFSHLTLHHRVSLIGEGKLNTELLAMDSDYSYFINLDKGPVTTITVKGFAITGNSNNSEQTGLYLYGLPQDTTPYHGGLWYSNFEDLSVSKFTKHQIHMEGNDPRSSALVPIQFNIFKNVQAFGNKNATGNVLNIIRQNGQTLFYQCTFDQAADEYYNISSVRRRFMLWYANLSRR